MNTGSSQDSIPIDNISLGLSTSPLNTISSGGSDSTIGHLNTPPTSRARSGSLFSIWNEPSVNHNNNVSHSHEMATSTSRNRSYTTTAALPSITIDSFSESLQKSSAPRVSTSPFISVPNNDMIILDNFQTNLPRLRSQTISGTPISSQSTLPHPSESLNAPHHFPQVFETVSLNPSSASILPYNQLPQLFDDVDFTRFLITTSFDNPNLGPTKYLLFDNLPLIINAHKLFGVLSNSLNPRMGNIHGIRITTTTTSKLALVECTSIDTAMSLKASFNHLELVPGNILYVAFAKVDDVQNIGQQRVQPQHSQQLPSPAQPLPQLQQQQQQQPMPLPQLSPNHNTNHNHNHNHNHNQQPQLVQHSLPDKSEKPDPTDILSIQQNLMNSIGKLSSTVDAKKIESLINKCIAYSNDQYQSDFGPLPDPIPLRQFDSPTLRDLRKVLENNEAQLIGQNVDGGEVMSSFELEELCLAMLDELPELSYDYLGNTIVQKLFTLVESSLVKLMMVKEVAPYLTQLGIHKNGTWAIQKIINLCHSDYQQMYLIGASLKPYAVKLFNDQFGNYVIQGCIKFGSPFNDFVFEAMLDNFLEISVGRFGARCIRTILESCHDSSSTSPVTNEQVLLVAGLIIEFANELAVNSNGSLLITWYLDTFKDCDSKIELLMSKFLPNIRALCVHKLANLTVLKILNNRIDDKSRVATMDAIFNNKETLEYILQESDNSNTTAGPLFI